MFRNVKSKFNYYDATCFRNFQKLFLIKLGMQNNKVGTYYQNLKAKSDTESSFFSEQEWFPCTSVQKQVCPVQSQIFQYDGHVNAKKSQKYIVVYVLLETVV